MSDRYPQFTRGVEKSARTQWMVWQGRIRPWPTSVEDAAQVYESLRRGEPVGVLAGTVVPLDDGHAGAPWPEYLDPDIRHEVYRLMVVHRPPPAHPRAFVVHPTLPSCVPHRYGDGAICPVTPHAGEWTWETGTLADYMDQVSIWLVKASIVRHTGNPNDWIGPESPHDPTTIARIPASAPCWCGSGLPKGTCHPQLDR